MATIRVTVNSSSARMKLAKIRKGMNPDAQRRVLKQAAQITRTRLVRNTPKRWTGQTRRAWMVIDATPRMVIVTNTSRVMGFLESGTRAHGPVRARRLFIPLTRKAAQAGPRGVMRANRQLSLEQAFGVSSGRRRPPFVYGRDFVFARRVRGIRPLRIVAYQREQSRIMLRLMMIRYLRGLVV